MLKQFKHTAIRISGDKEVAIFLKKGLDIALASLFLVILFPILVVSAVAILWESGWPFIHKRHVIGKGGVPFAAYKFRSMIHDADKVLMENEELNHRFNESFKLKEDPRVTKVGGFLRRYSIDETMQLFNILKGQMSIVGPRMMTAVELERYGRQKDLVLSVKPGLTGLWQISGRQDISFQRRMELDIAYVMNWTIQKDIEILFNTVGVVLKAKGAY